MIERGVGVAVDNDSNDFGEGELLKRNEMFCSFNASVGLMSHELNQHGFDFRCKNNLCQRHTHGKS